MKRLNESRRDEHRSPSTGVGHRWRQPVSRPRPCSTTKDLDVYYGEFRPCATSTSRSASTRSRRSSGPSGCGKSTVLRCFDRMNDLIEIARVEGTILYHGVDLYGPDVDPVEVRRRSGMVFQKPNPFPKSIYDNLAFGPAQRHQEEGPSSTTSSRSRCAGGAVGRGQGPAQGLGARPLGRSAAAAVHRPLRRRRARRDPDGRAVLGARPDRHGTHRGPDEGDQAASTRS
jgi:hypothetical protein